MKKTLSLFSVVIGMLLLTVGTYAQTYILNEDFSSANVITPPTGWNNINVSGAASDLWHFDNNTNRSIGYPIIGKFAIFDSERNSGDSIAEKVILESPYLDCSYSPNTLLYFNHQFVGGRGGKGILEVYNGLVWHVFTTFNNSTNGVVSEVFNLSPYFGGVTNAKFRFTWEGDSSFYWAVDNIKIFAPLSRDVNLKSLDNPIMPFQQGLSPIKVSLLNEGYQTLNSVQVKWSVDGIRQPDFSWSGNLQLGQEDSGVVIGNYNFPAGIIKNLKIWTDNPNGLSDLNHYNDTVNTNLAAALCGTYTIGGISPDYVNFNEAAFALNKAGVTCPVIFKVRNGIYNEQVRVFSILGSSEINTVTFESENGDSSNTAINFQETNPDYDYTLGIIGTKNISFKKIGIRRTNGYGCVTIQNKSENVSFENCMIDNVNSPVNSYNTNLNFVSNDITGHDVLLHNNNNILFQNNKIRRLYLVRDSSITIKDNKISNDGTCDGDVRNIYFENCKWATANNNKLFIWDCSAPRGVEVLNSSNISVTNN